MDDKLLKFENPHPPFLPLIDESFINVFYENSFFQPTLTKPLTSPIARPVMHLPGPRLTISCGSCGLASCVMVPSAHGPLWELHQPP